ncbi:hypothetical protein KAW50_01290 [candidate division WOR-3 bacterium]|nr:hypothetical protein [candidate division WOR-3 bacterium]
MKRKMNSLLSGGVILVISLLIFATGCKKENPTETDVPKLYLMGEIQRRPYSANYPDSFYCDEGVNVSNTEVVPSVQINEQELELYPSTSGLYFREHFPLTPETEYELVVTTSSDTATATVKLPGNFSIIAPDTSYVLPKGSSLDISWDSASYANHYRVHLYVYYRYSDTSGNSENFRFSRDTILSETSITYESSLLWPNLSEIDSIFYGHGDFDVSAIAGPSLVPGTPGNVSGDGIGFFWAKQKRESDDFHVGTAKKTSKEDRARRHKEALKEQDELWKQRIEKLKERLINN